MNAPTATATELFEAPGEHERPATRAPLTGAAVSLVLHMLLMLVLGLWGFPEKPQSEWGETLARVERPQELLTESLEADLTPSLSSGGELEESIEIAPHVEGPDEIEPVIGPDGVDVETAPLEIAGFDSVVGRDHSILIDELPEVAGQAAVAASGSAQAVDRITEELAQILWRRKALVLWCFDQSGSMQPERKRIRDRIDKIYQELGVRGTTDDGMLLTAVGSYGASFALHTSKPTPDTQEVLRAIDAVPVDESGEEVMLSAIAEMIRRHERYKAVHLSDLADSSTPQPEADAPIAFERENLLLDERRMILILVTDESGDRLENLQYLEDALAVARKAHCRIYVLGREAMFNHPYARVTWTDPQTKEAFTVSVDRGPEVPMPEVLQTNGFGHRGDIFASGFGSYEQARLAQETGGIFFLLPGLDETPAQLKAREERMRRMRRYLPSLDSRARYQGWRDRSKLRQAVFQAIADLNPWDQSLRREVHLRNQFHADARFLPEAQQALAHARELLKYHDTALQRLLRMKPLREEEPSRWQANYDLTVGELAMLRALTYEYIQQLQTTLKAPQPKNPKTNLRTIRVVAQTRADTKSTAYVAQAKELLEHVIEAHPSTPWAYRAKWDLGRGFGIDLEDQYVAPTKPQPAPARGPPKL